MKRQSLSSSVLALCLLVCSGLAQHCDWDPSIEPDQALDLTYLKAGDLESIAAVSDLDSCRAACCDKPGCDAVMMGFPMDGGPQCMLVRCLVQGRDVCVFQPSPEPSTQFKVYRKKAKPDGRGEAEAGGKTRIVPLLGPGEPRSNDSTAVLCRLPMKVGSCRAAFPKFFYNVTNQSCQKFIYGGCEANGNNFDTRDECEATCSGVTGSLLPDESTPAPQQLPVKAARMAPPLKTAAEGGVEATPAASETVQDKETEMSADDFAELCGAEPQVGPCRAAFQRWYYNTKTSSCHSFIYGGCKGNKNNHASQESCMAACTVTVLPSSKKVSSEVDMSPEFEDQCTVSPDPGPCRAAFPMFYHDPNTGTCRSFIYGGCHGNQNRYSSEEECRNRCIGEGSFGGRGGRARNRWTAAIFLFITVAAISILLLAALIVMMMRRHGPARRPSSISDKEELLPDEQSSVESLNVPDSPEPNKA